MTAKGLEPDELGFHHLNNSYNGIFLQEKNNNEGNIGNFKSWKAKMHAIFDQNTLG